VVAIDIATHQQVGSFFPAGKQIDGGGIWSSGGVSVDPATGNVFTATGNAFTDPESYRYSENVVELSSNLKVLGFNYPGLTAWTWTSVPLPSSISRLGARRCWQRRISQEYWSLTSVAKSRTDRRSGFKSPTLMIGSSTGTWPGRRRRTCFILATRPTRARARRNMALWLYRWARTADWTSPGKRRSGPIPGWSHLHRRRRDRILR
jgi:hypothetical protein